MLDEIMYSVIRNLAFTFWLVMSFKVTAQVVFWRTGVMVDGSF
jgi:hypothetical protein